MFNLEFNLNKMKTILVPTDFSTHAFTAARYAAELAKKKNWQVALCHAYKVFYTAFQSDTQNQSDKDEVINEAEDNMKRLLQKLHQMYPEVVITGECVLGDIGLVIQEQAEKIHADMIVMGTKGATGLRLSLLGSNTFDIIKKSPIPVLAVPQRIKNYDFLKIGFATNYHAAEIAALQDFVDIMENSFEVIPFHLYQKDKVKEASKMEQWKAKISKMVSCKNLNFKIAPTRNMPAGINRFIKKEKLDALVMTAFHKKLFDRMFHKDLVKVIAHHPVIPVLFMKEN